MTLRVLDLFSGIGAYALGLQRAGMEVIAVCEVDDWCQALLRKHFPGVPQLADISTANFDEVKADVIIGGFPCQDISNAGTRTGIAGARSGLFWELVRAVRVVRPGYVILENVAALLDRGRGMGIVLGALAEERYDAEWDCISLDEIGAPHGRARVWIAAADRDRAERADRSGEAVRRGQRRAPEGCETSAHRDDTNLGEGAAIPVSRRQRIREGEAQPAANADRSRELQPLWLLSHVRRWIHNGDGGAFWSCDWQAKFEALRRMDVRPPTRLDRARDSRAIGHLGNSNPPQIPELIGRAILQAEAI